MTDSQPFSWAAYYRAPIVGIIRGLPVATVRSVAAAYAAAGLTTLEITMNSPQATEAIREIRAAFPALNVGAGTVCTPGDLQDALAAGAQFIVTPVLTEAVVESAVAQGIPIFPGAYTPTEIHRAWELGATAVKIFPADRLGPGYLRALAGPLPQIRLLPTGGVALDNIRSFFEAGAIGVGMGSTLLDQQLIDQEDYAGLQTHFRQILAEIQAYINH